MKEKEEFRNSIIHFLRGTIQEVTHQSLKKDKIKSLYKSITSFIGESFGRKKNLPALFEAHLLNPLCKVINGFDEVALQTDDETEQLILENIPKFVYYSDYGNLDSEIYLPRVIEDFKRDDLTESARAKARTLQVLFKYVNLSPEEIYELGNDRRKIIKTVNQNQAVISETEENPSAEEVADWSEKKRERNILLSSAASELTKGFKNWWQQGNYIFAFNADGNHFRINVSDELRPEPLELERRSRGLQWFFSFFLVFLVETKEKHRNTVLLLDEPGHSLHPVAQYDLVKFFRELAKNNQLVYTTHSPFLVDMENLANVKAVYINKQTGRTEVASDLRQGSNDASRSLYPVHAALGLTVSDTLLIGCQPILVEGRSDQIYLNLMKRYLIGKGKFQHSRELVFVQTGARKGATTITNLLTSIDGELPYILLDSDKPGNDFSQFLKNNLYNQSQERVLQVGHFLGEDQFEIEDLMPSRSIVRIIDRKFRADTYFDDSYDSSKPIVNQIEGWLNGVDISPEKGWKVEIVREAINSFDNFTNELPNELEEKWQAIFESFINTNV